MDTIDSNAAYIFGNVDKIGHFGCGLECMR
jgi:hypothetical protein